MKRKKVYWENQNLIEYWEHSETFGYSQVSEDEGARWEPHSFKYYCQLVSDEIFSTRQFGLANY